MYVVIVGGGKVGEYLAHVLLDGGNTVVLIESDPETANRLSFELEHRSLVLQGDGCDSKIQEEAGTGQADIFVSVTGHDDDNLVSCQIARSVFRVPRCVARVNSPRNLRIFDALGIESVSSTVLIAKLIEEEALLGSMTVSMALSNSNVALAEITIPRLRHPTEGDGIRVDEVPMPEDSLIVAISSSDGMNVASPDMMLYARSKVIVAADSEALDDVRAVFKNL